MKKLLILALLIFGPFANAATGIKINELPQTNNFYDISRFIMEIPEQGTNGAMSVEATNVIKTLIKLPNFPVGGTPYTLVGGGTGGTNLFIDFVALGSTNDLLFTMGSSNIAVVATNVIAGYTKRIAIKMNSTGFGTCTTNGSYPNSIRIGTTVTGFNFDTNANWYNVFTLYGIGTNAILAGNLLSFAP